MVAYTGLPANLVKDMPLIGWDDKVRADKWQAVIDMMVASGELKSSMPRTSNFAEEIKPYVVK